MEDIEEVPEGGFDAIVAMGNSFAHLPDFSGDQRDQQLAIQVHKKCLSSLVLSTVVQHMKLYS